MLVPPAFTAMDSEARRDSVRGADVLQPVLGRAWIRILPDMPALWFLAPTS